MDDHAVRQCLLELLDALVGDLGVVQIQDVKISQPFQVLQLAKESERRFRISTSWAQFLGSTPAPIVSLGPFVLTSTLYGTDAERSSRVITRCAPFARAM